jgi:hypothetical protein
MSLTYTTFTAELAVLAQFNLADVNFLANLPSCIDYATDRITRELNLLSTTTANSTLTTTIGTRIVNLATLSPVFNVIQDINVIASITSGGSDFSPDFDSDFGPPDSSAVGRIPLTIQSRAFMNQVYGSASITGIPEFFHMVTDQMIMVGPYPDQVYPLEIIGTVRPTPISSANPTNWIVTYLPDLFLAAAMIQMSAFKMNFGAESDDPQQAQSWEAQYTKLRDSAATEDSMRKYYSTGWNPELPNQFSPART